MVRFYILVCLFALTAEANAALRLARVFSDHMVLQRETVIPVWGWSQPGESVTVEFQGQTKSATADSSGKWLLRLDPVPAKQEPSVLKVRSSSAAESIEIRDVLVGEVWLGSGQSNMAMTVDRARDFDREAAAANFPLIRMFTEKSGGSSAPRADASGEWSVCTPESVGKFSATLYFFGRKVHRDLQVPVGLINSSVAEPPSSHGFRRRRSGPAPN